MRIHDRPQSLTSAATKSSTVSLGTRRCTRNEDFVWPSYCVPRHVKQSCAKSDCVTRPQESPTPKPDFSTLVRATRCVHTHRCECDPRATAEQRRKLLVLYEKPDMPVRSRLSRCTVQNVPVASCNCDCRCCVALHQVTPGHVTLTGTFCLEDIVRRFRPCVAVLVVKSFALRA